jgi:hypothetical protein
MEDPRITPVTFAKLKRWFPESTINSLNIIVNNFTDEFKEFEANALYATKLSALLEQLNKIELHVKELYKLINDQIPPSDDKNKVLEAITEDIVKHMKKLDLAIKRYHEPELKLLYPTKVNIYIKETYSYKEYNNILNESIKAFPDHDAIIVAQNNNKKKNRELIRLIIAGKVHLDKTREILINAIENASKEDEFVNVRKKLLIDELNQKFDEIKYELAPHLKRRGRNEEEVYLGPTANIVPEQVLDPKVRRLLRGVFNNPDLLETALGNANLESNDYPSEFKKYQALFQFFIGKDMNLILNFIAEVFSFHDDELKQS